jgi:hypothetical protein
VIRAIATKVLGRRLYLYAGVAVLALIAAVPIAHTLGKTQGRELGYAKATADQNAQYAVLMQTVRDRTAQVLADRNKRELARYRRSAKLLEDLRNGKNCKTVPMDGCLRRYLELRHAAETAGEL